MKCKWCKKRFDEEDAMYDFESQTRFLYYDNLAIRLCGDCALKVIDEKIDEVYFETCAECGRRFDLIEEETKFEYNPNDYGSLRDYWDDGDKPRCAECAVEEAERRFEEYRNEYPEDFDDNEYDSDDESIDLDEAAQIWASHGKEEDYMYGFTEDELEDAL